jgi:uncharacterized membrane protein
MTKIALTLHVLSVIVWVGGMFFAHMALRPSVATLAPEQRLPLLAAVLGKFFHWVVVAITLLLLTGLYLVGKMGGFKALGLYVHVMFGLGLLMMLIFGHIYFAGFKKLKRAVAVTDLPSAAKAMGQIRLLVGVNLVIGFVVVIAVYTLRGF